MANTYTRLYFHVVFAVKNRDNLISENWEVDLYKYITGITTNKGHKLMVVNGMPDHLHLLIGTKPNINLSDLIRDIKANSSKWINEQKFTPFRFQWQAGFGAFTIGYSQVETVINYIRHQKQHHRKKTFREEYVDFLQALKIDYKDEYIFD